MADVLPVTISGWKLEIQERPSELIRTADDEIQGLIKWKLEKRRGFRGEQLSNTLLMGEDEAGRLIFLAQDVSSSCTERKSPRLVTSWVNNRGGIEGLIELPANQFGPSTNYKIGLTVIAKASPGILSMDFGVSDLSPPECSFFEHEKYRMFIVNIFTMNSDTFESASFVNAVGEHIDNAHTSPDQERDIRISVETDAIDFNALYPGQAVTCRFELWGKLIAVEKVILSKKQF